MDNNGEIIDFIASILDIKETQVITYLREGLRVIPWTDFGLWLYQLGYSLFLWLKEKYELKVFFHPVLDFDSGKYNMLLAIANFRLGNKDLEVILGKTVFKYVAFQAKDIEKIPS